MGKLKQHYAAYLVITLSAAFYVGLSYFTVRTQVNQVFLFAGLLFAGYFFAQRLPQFPLKGWIGAAIGFRLICLFAFPNLSDDLYRFLWDGQLWIHGESPFLRLPVYHAMAGFPIEGAGPELYGPMNSKEYFTIYPPICQLVFALAAGLASDSIYGGTLVMKTILVAAEIGSIALIVSILKTLHLPERNVLWYALNPLVIFEFSGNAHFEALMICFLLGAVYLFLKGKWQLSAVVFAFAVCTKLLPLMFLPFLIQRLGWLKTIAYGSITGLVTLTLFLPFVNLQLVVNFADSFSLYFERFEFNASIFYIIRAVGFWLVEKDIIRQAGWVLSVVVLLGILTLAWKEKVPKNGQWPRQMLLALTVYLGFATIVHPWYVTTLVALAVFTPWRYAMVWSATAVLSYYTYRDTTYTESYWLIAIEYAAVAAWMLYDWKRKEKPGNGEVKLKTT